MEYSPELKERIEQLIEADWREVKVLADKYDIKKGKDESWNDQAEAIALAESKEKDSIKPEPKAKKETIPPLAPIQGNYCPNCQSKLRTNLMGEPTCPIQNERCPRNGDNT